MSTYYYFGCKLCKQRGGFFSHQAWGWGNFDIISSFKFLALHADCRIEKTLESALCVFSEHDDYLYDEMNELPEEDFIAKTKGIMPRSNDWQKVTKSWNTAEEEWEKEFRGRDN